MLICPKCGTRHTDPGGEASYLCSKCGSVLKRTKPETLAVILGIAGAAIGGGIGGPAGAVLGGLIGAVLAGSAKEKVAK
jgi:hypothetical protein